MREAKGMRDNSFALFLHDGLIQIFPMSLDILGQNLY